VPKDARRAKRRGLNQRVLALAQEGKTAREIADALGCLAQYVHKTAKRQGIALTPARKGRRPKVLPSGDVTVATEVVRLVAQGLASKEIAARLGTTDAAIIAHTKSALRTTGLRNRTQLALWAVAQGIAPNPYAERIDV